MRSLLAGISLILLVGCSTPAAVPTATPSPAPKPTVPTTPTATAVPTPVASTVAICNTGGIGAYVRAEPGGAGLRAWPDGTALEIVGADRNVDGAVWRNVQDDQGNKGWTKTDYLCPKQ